MATYFRAGSPDPDPRAPPQLHSIESRPRALRTPFLFAQFLCNEILNQVLDRIARQFFGCTFPPRFPADLLLLQLRVAALLSGTQVGDNAGCEHGGQFLHCDCSVDLYRHLHQTD
jgi:hypothetical protein